MFLFFEPLGEKKIKPVYLQFGIIKFNFLCFSRIIIRDMEGLLEEAAVEAHQEEAGVASVGEAHLSSSCLCATKFEN